MVKQIRDDELITKLIKEGKGYFRWLQEKSGLEGPLSSMLADTEFISKDGLDDVLMTKAKEEVRRKYAEDVCEDSEDCETAYKSIRGSCCLFEVVFCLADSLNEMFEDCDAFDGPAHFFGILMHNAGLDIFDEEDLDMRPESVRIAWEKRIRIILEREYDEYGNGGLFPCPKGGIQIGDQRKKSLWQQMNDWVDQHTNEDGEWVD